MGGDEQLLGAYPFYFGVSCAFVALDLVSRKRRELLDVNGGWGSRSAEMMLKGSAQLLGLLVERAQARGEAMEKKLKKAHLEVEEMKQRRTEDAKANEKVVAIFAAHEQRWIAERKSLRFQIQALTNRLQIDKSKHDDAISTLEKRVEGESRARMLKDEALEAEARKRKELEEKLHLADELLDEMTDRAKRAAQDHSAELWKHKTAFAEIVSKQHQMDAEMNRTLRQAEVARQELEEALEQKVEAFAMIDKLSEQILRIQRDSEQKDKILSSMLRKLKLDAAERQTLLKEVKLSKAKKKQAELEMERWRNMWESSRNKKFKDIHSVDTGSLRNRRLELVPVGSLGHNSMNLLLEAEDKKEESSTSTALKCHDYCSFDENGDADWVRKETEKYAAILEQKHRGEVEAFTEQLRQKDEELEAFRWQLLSMELETKRLRSHIEDLNGNLSHLKGKNVKMEARLLDKEQEIKLLKEQFNLHVQNSERNNLYYLPTPDACQALWSEVEITKNKQKKETDDSMANSIGDFPKTSSKAMGLDAGNDTEERENVHTEINKSDAAEPPSPSNYNSREYTDGFSEMPSPEQSSGSSSSEDQAKSTPVVSSSNAAGEEIEKKEMNLELANIQANANCKQEAETANKLSLIKTSLARDTSLKMDIQALGVSYKIKRLNQQLVVLEKLASSPAMMQITNNDQNPSTPDVSSDKETYENKQQNQGLLLVQSLLNKQLKRYQSLEEKTNNLCSRMNECYKSGGGRDVQNGRTKEQSETLARFLEETFQLQRYIVATGQKLMEMQSRLGATLNAAAARLDESVGFNIELFADIVRTLFREVQRGLEVRISRIIGDLEGTLAFDGILHR
ncbi:rootletin-like isoform X2 [Zingiber officinale]|uniref:rootletin-like isoform X2 n=1 Tax=Zingiber officinale TaxID=94328 RepID=UPI001C4C5BBB|nr:rootletin-like isoform X2 [Zingiber officinale]